MAIISLDLVAPFLAVAEHGSFSAAAKRLGIETSSVSRAVARLEEAVGDRLFLRTTRRVSLTETGQSVRDRLAEPHASLDAALKAVLDAADQPRGRIVVTTPPDFGAVVVTDAVARFVRQHPHVEVEVRVTSQFLDLVGAGIDAAIRLASRRLADSTLKARNLGQLEIGAFAAPSYVETRGVPRSPEEAGAHTWVNFGPLRELEFKRPGATSRLRTAGRVTCDDMSFVHHAVRNGAGLGVLPLFLAGDDLRQGRLVQLLSRWTLVGGSVWFVTPKTGQRTARAVDGLRECITDVLTARGLSVAV